MNVTQRWKTFHQNFFCFFVQCLQKTFFLIFLISYSHCRTSLIFDNGTMISRGTCHYHSICKFDLDKNADARVFFVDRSSIGGEVRGVLTRARVERRLICGLLPAITFLEKRPEDALLCMLPETRPGDATTHMQTVLLQAFCYENYIPVIQVRITKMFIFFKSTENCLPHYYCSVLTFFFNQVLL